MRSKKPNALAGLEYVGKSGISAYCKEAVMRLLQFDDHINLARILTSSSRHGLLLSLSYDRLVAIKCGFTSGYLGEGPRTFAEVLELLREHDVTLDEYIVDDGLLDRLDASGLTYSDLERINRTQPVRPHWWPDYMADRWSLAKRHESIWREFPPVIPYSVVDARLIDLAKTFFENPDDRLMTGYRRLEDIVRKRIGSNDHGTKLFSRAFAPGSGKLEWQGLDPSEQTGRANLFTAVYMAYRNPRAHREAEHDVNTLLRELLMLNQLYILERESRERAIDVASANI